MTNKDFRVLNSAWVQRDSWISADGGTVAWVWRDSQLPLEGRKAFTKYFLVLEKDKLGAEIFLRALKS